MSISIAMATLAKIDSVTAHALANALKKDWPELYSISDIEEKDGVISFLSGDLTAFLGHMPAPIPWSDLEEACATSVLWPNAEEELRSHEMHLVFSVTGGTTAIERARFLTQLISSASTVCGQLNGIYWGDAGLVIPSAMFREFSVKILPKSPPLHMWVNFRVGRNGESSTSGFTRGLDGLGLMDIETESSPEPPAELRDRLESIAGYLLEHGLVIKDGDTVGGDETERIRVRFGPSNFGAEKRVMHLDYATTKKKPFWKVW